MIIFLNVFVFPLMCRKVAGMSPRRLWDSSQARRSLWDVFSVTVKYRNSFSVSATSLRRLRQLRWRLCDFFTTSQVELVSATVGDVSETSQKPPGDWKKSFKNKTCLNFPRLPGYPVSRQETSRRRLRNKRRLQSRISRELVSRQVRYLTNVPWTNIPWSLFEDR